MKPYVGSEPYTAERVTAFVKRLEKLSGQADMLVLLADGVGAFIGFQSALATLQSDIQRDITTLKKRMRRAREARAALRTLRTLRWYARCLGDALAWQVLLFDRKTIAALNSGEKPPVAQPDHSDAAVFAMAAHLLGSQYGVPIIHDITNWLRVGDITFLRWVSDESNEWFFRTVEVKSSLTKSVTDADGSVSATVMADLYSNEPLDLPVSDRQATAHADDDLIDQSPNTPERRTRADRRIGDQFVRLDDMVRRRDLASDAVTNVEGMPNVMLLVDHATRHHWADLRRGIRHARRDGYSFFDIDGFIGYALVYNESGVSADDLLKPQIREDVRDRLLGGRPGVHDSLIVQQIPLLERHDAEGAPVMRFFNYAIPKRAKADLIHNRLLITAIVNMGRLAPALVERGVGVETPDSALAHRGYPYTANLVWPDGETDCLAIPSSTVSQHLKVAVHEFCGLGYVADHVASVTKLPDVISREEWLDAVGETLSET